MALTADLVARVERVEPDPGPMPGQEYLTDPEYDALALELIEQNGGGPFWVFAYGSLIWKPECAMTEHRRATAHGWHRSFCMKLTRWRGTPDCPGLMMALDRGGRCDGVICRLPDDDRFKQLVVLLKREIDQAMRRLIADGVADGSIEARDVRLTAFTLAGALNWPAHWHQPDGGQSAGEIAAQMVDILTGK